MYSVFLRGALEGDEFKDNYSQTDEEVFPFRGPAAGYLYPPLILSPLRSIFFSRREKMVI